MIVRNAHGFSSQSWHANKVTSISGEPSFGMAL